MEFQWQLKSPNLEHLESLKSSLNLSDTSARILLSRGVDSYQKAKEFFNPVWENHHDPFLMKDMDKAVLRLSKAIKENQKILVYGDYDVDGTTSVAMMFLFLTQKLNHQNCTFYVPDRFTEGYGVSKEAMQWAKDQDIELIITLDCGIKAHESLDIAAQLGIEVIVCDHHQAPDVLPKAIAILDPKRIDCPYPFKELSGCGVGFKLIQAISKHLKLPDSEIIPFLDLVCISTCADIVPIIGENRIWVTLGLPLLKNSTRPGLKALMDIAGLSGKEMDVSKVVFGISPRINAAGRMHHAKLSVELLISPDHEKAIELARYIHDHNSERQTYDEKTTLEALDLIRNNARSTEAYTTVLYNSNWNKGIIGIVASRCIEHYYRPTIILTNSNGKLTGSARSIRSFDLYQALEACREHLIQFGGHYHAAGLTLESNQLEAFSESFENYTKSIFGSSRPSPILEIDGILNLENLSFNFFNLLKRFSPFGPGNEEPIFVSTQLELEGGVQLLKEKHLKFRVKHSNGKICFDAIAFGMANKRELLTNGKFDLCYHLQENNFNGKTTIQLMVKDIKNTTENAL